MSWHGAVSHIASFVLRWKTSTSAQLRGVHELCWVTGAGGRMAMLPVAANKQGPFSAPQRFPFSFLSKSCRQVLVYAFASHCQCFKVEQRFQKSNRRLALLDACQCRFSFCLETKRLSQDPIVSNLEQNSMQAPHVTSNITKQCMIVDEALT